MLSKNTYCTMLCFFVMLLHSQNSPIKLSTSSNQIRGIEALLLQEKSFDKDTLALKNYLQPLQKTKQNQIIYEAMLANGYNNFYNNLNKKSDWHYQQSIKKASELKASSLKIWTQLNYVYYLYHNRDYVNLTPMLLKITDRIEQIDSKQLLLPGESFKKIGWMMQTFGDYENSFHYLNLAKKHTAKKTSEYAAILDAIGFTYLRIEKLKEAESYFQQTALLATQIHDEVRYAKAIGNIALIKQKKGDYKSAIDLLEKDIRISESNKSDQNTMYASILLAESYLAEKNWNKANAVLHKAENIAQAAAYFKKSELHIIKLKLEILKQQNKTDNELTLRRRMAVLEDSLKNKDGDMAINQANWIIQKTDFQQKINSSQDQLKYESAMKNIYGIVILLVLLLIFLLVQNFKKQIKNKQIEHKQNLILLELDKIKTEQKLSEAHENLNTQIKYLKDKNIQIKKLKIEIDQIKESSSANLENKTGKLNSLLESHLMTENNWNTFKREFQKEQPEFYRMLEEDFPEITDSNKRILLLEKLNFSKSEISELLGITPEAVKKSRQRLKKKLGTKFDLLFKHINS